LYRGKSEAKSSAHFFLACRVARQIQLGSAPRISKSVEIRMVKTGRYRQISTVRRFKSEKRGYRARAPLESRSGMIACGFAKRRFLVGLRVGHPELMRSIIVFL